MSYMSYTNEQIILQTFLVNGLVPKSSIHFTTSIANAKNASPKQLQYVKSIVNEILADADKKPEFNDTALFDMFTRALQKLKYPKITLRTGKTNARVQLSCSRNYPDTIYVSEHGYNSIQYGKIQRGSGCITFRSQEGRALASELIELLNEFCENPEAVALKYSKLTHSCCYCSLPLDTPESLAVGYGPVCAKHYGLAWGKNVTRTKPVLQELYEPTFEQNMEDEYVREMFEAEQEGMF